MLKKVCSLAVLSFVLVSSFVLAEIEYEIHDIGTLQTRSSQVIDFNNQGQILGSYNIDGTSNGDYFFLRETNGSFYTIPSKLSVYINWRFLTENGKVYGTYDNGSFATLFMWDKDNGAVKLGNLPGREISAINNVGQVLIKSVQETENGKSIQRPVIWNNGKITKLDGLEGNLGIVSDESYGLDMNNNGDVVGKSVVYLSYKNNIYKQTHATKWINGRAISLHKTFPTDGSSAMAINDLCEVLIKNSDDGSMYCVDENGNFRKIANYLDKINNLGYVYYGCEVVDRENNLITTIKFLNDRIKQSSDMIWSKINLITKINDNGEIISKAKTIYGEEHVMLLIPVKPK